MLAPRLTVYPALALDPRALARPGTALRRCSTPPTPRAWPATRRGARGARSRHRHCWSEASSPAWRRPGGAVAEVLDGVALGQEVGTAEIVTLFGARGPEVRMVAEVADDLRRQAVGDTVTYVRNRNINYTNVCTFKCRFCAFSKGPLSLNLRGTPYLLELDEITRRVAEAEAEGATEVCLQGGIHPNFDGDYYLHVLEAVRAASAGDPHPRLHGAGGDRGGAALGGATGRVPHPAEGGRAQDPAGHGGRDPRRRGARRDLPRQDLDRRVARGAPHRALGGPALEHHDHVRLGGAAAQLGPPPGAHPGAASARPAASPSSCRCPSCTWPRRSTSSARRGGGPPSARRCSCTRWPASRMPVTSTTSRSAGSRWGPRGTPGAAGRGQRPGRDPDGREHLAGGGGHARAAHGGARSSRPSWRRWDDRWCSARRCTRLAGRAGGRVTRRGRRRRGGGAQTRVRRPVREPLALAGPGPRAAMP